MCLNRDWRKKIYLSFVQTCLAKTSIIFLTHFLTWCVLSIQLEELRRHSQQQMFSSPPLLVPYDTTCKTLYWVRRSARKSHTPGYDMYYANLTSLLLLCIKRKRERKKMKNEMLYIKSGLDYCTLYFLVGNSSPPFHCS